METIVLSGKKELDIYINPQRQNLLRCMRVSGVPMTAKQISVQLGISASAVQHHIKKLVELGVIGLSHTERIHGITASYYKVLPKTVSFGGLPDDDTDVQRLTFMQNELNSIFTNFVSYNKGNAALDGDTLPGDVLSGIIYLGHEEAKELYDIIRNFLDSHEQKEGSRTVPWEYALIAYPVGGNKDA